MDVLRQRIRAIICDFEGIEHSWCSPDKVPYPHVVQPVEEALLQGREGTALEERLTELTSGDATKDRDLIVATRLQVVFINQSHTICAVERATRRVQFKDATYLKEWLVAHPRKGGE